MKATHEKDGKSVRPIRIQFLVTSAHIEAVIAYILETEDLDFFGGFASSGSLSKNAIKEVDQHIMSNFEYEGRDWLRRQPHSEHIDIASIIAKRLYPSFYE